MTGMSLDDPLNLLFPLWQLAIGGVVLLVVVISVHRLLLRGPSRMSRALIVTGGAAVAVVVLGILIGSR
jgi:hypothetical protein